MKMGHRYSRLGPSSPTGHGNQNPNGSYAFQLLFLLAWMTLVLARYRRVNEGPTPSEMEPMEALGPVDDYAEARQWKYLSKNEEKEPVPKSFEREEIPPQSTLLRNNNNHAHPNVKQDLVSMAKRSAGEDNVVTLVYASHSYRQPLLNWLVSVKRARGSVTKGVLLVCLDEALRNLMLDLGWDCYLEVINKESDVNSLNKDTVKSLWVTRVEHVKRILTAGLTIVLSDTDAIWLKDPITPLLTKTSDDIVASKANFPYDSPWGATLCMGFIILRSNKNMIAFADKALQQTQIDLDDQIGFNKVLFSLPFKDTNGKNLAFGRRLQPTGTSAAEATFYLDDKKSQSIKVTLLSHNVVARVCFLVEHNAWQNEVLVGHCHVNEGKPAPTSKHKGNQKTHTTILEKYGLYYLLPHWPVLLEQASKQDEKDFEAFIGSLDISNEGFRI